jgi:lysophospholipase L1-like esterase
MRSSSFGVALSRAPEGREDTRSPWRDRCRRLAGLAVLLALLPACGGGGGAAPEPAAPPAWVVLGSSTAAGVGATEGRSWAARLATTLAARGLRVDNRARSGANTYQALPADAARPAGRPATDPQQDVARALETAPRVLVLAFPSNDAMLGYPAAETVANLRLMRDAARRRGVGVLVLSSQPRDDAGSGARAAMAAADTALAAELGACFVDVRAALSAADGRIAPAYAAGDGIHLNDAGHALIHTQLWATVAAGGCVTPP